LLLESSDLEGISTHSTNATLAAWANETKKSKISLNIEVSEGIQYYNGQISHQYEVFTENVFKCAEYTLRSTLLLCANITLKNNNYSLI